MYPVIALSFAQVRGVTYQETQKMICQILEDLYSAHMYLRDSDVLNAKDREYFDRVSAGMDRADAAAALNKLSDFMMRYYGRKPIILRMSMMRQCRRHI